MENEKTTQFTSQEISEQLKAYFPESQLEWRVQQCGETKKGIYAMVLCYVQARAIEDRLDEVVGFDNWQNEIRVEGDNIIARLGIRINGEWIWKENGASQTEIEAFKGGISGAIKRVASSGFGIGRYLYQLDTTFAETSETAVDGWNKGKTKAGKFFWWKTPSIPPKFLPDRKFTQEEAESAYEWAIRTGGQKAYEAGLERFKVKNLRELPYSKRKEFIAFVKEYSTPITTDENKKQG
jgi:hypothetical protein